MTARNDLRFAFHLDRSGRSISLRDGPAPPPATTPRVPRIAKLVALAHRFDRLLAKGEVKSMADLARLGRVTRARITQIMDLLLLAPDIQEALLFLPAPQRGHDLVALRTVRYVCATPIWAEQRARWAEIVATFPSTTPESPSRVGGIE